MAMYIWKLQSSGLFGRTQEFTLKTEPAHLPSPSKIQARILANEVREKAANPGNALRQIVINAQIDLPLYAAPTIPILKPLFATPLGKSSLLQKFNSVSSI